MKSNQNQTQIYTEPYIASKSEALGLGLDRIGYTLNSSVFRLRLKHAILELARQSCVKLFQTRETFILKARLPSDSLQNGVVSKSPSDERRVLVGLSSLSRDNYVDQAASASCLESDDWWVRVCSHRVAAQAASDVVRLRWWTPGELHTALARAFCVTWSRLKFLLTFRTAFLGQQR